MNTACLRPALFRFLRELAGENRREWFQANRERYERDVRGPALELVAAMAPRLARLSPEIRAEAKKVGGALLRLERDRRFIRDLPPYKTWVGLQFRHARAREGPAPSYYLHLEPGRVYAAVGLWRPSAAAAGAVRKAIVADPEGWKRVVRGRAFRAAFELDGRALKRAPPGVDPAHPLLEDLKRADFVAVARLTQRDATAPGFVRELADLCAAGTPLVRFLSSALGLAF
jgi:uncharacterized protein (TIGR02453 family)